MDGEGLWRSPEFAFGTTKVNGEGRLYSAPDGSPEMGLYLIDLIHEETDD